MVNILCIGSEVTFKIWLQQIVTYILHDVTIDINYGELKTAQALGTMRWYVYIFSWDNGLFVVSFRAR